MCNDCRAEFLIAFSCQRRELCPSCAAKQGAMFGALLADDVLELAAKLRLPVQGELEGNRLIRARALVDGDRRADGLEVQELNGRLESGQEVLDLRRADGGRLPER